MLSRTICAVVLWASVGWAEPTEIRFQNTSETEATTAVRLCSINPARVESCEDVSSVCGPSEVCSEAFDIEPGEHEAYMRAAGAAGEWGDESNRVTLTVKAPGIDPEEAAAAIACMASNYCRADFDGNGEVTASDFGIFLREFSR